MENIIIFFSKTLIFFFKIHKDGSLGGKVKGKLRVQIYKLRLQIHEVNPRVRRIKAGVARLKARAGKLKARAMEIKITN